MNTCDAGVHHPSAACWDVVRAYWQRIDECWDADMQTVGKAQVVIDLNGCMVDQVADYDKLYGQCLPALAVLSCKEMEWGMVPEECLGLLLME